MRNAHIKKMYVCAFAVWYSN